MTYLTTLYILITPLLPKDLVAKWLRCSTTNAIGVYREIESSNLFKVAFLLHFHNGALRSRTVHGIATLK